jgi:hypothetical protein
LIGHLQAAGALIRPVQPYKSRLSPRVPPPIERNVGRDAEEPGRELGLRAVFAARTINADEDVLRQLFGNGVIAHQPMKVIYNGKAMHYTQIAGALGCSIPALKSLLFRAYETLRRRLAHLAPAITDEATRKTASAL